MNVEKAIFAVDENVNYQGFWEINSEICKKKLGITPVLFKITDEDSDFYEDEFGLVKKVKKIPYLKSEFQAQVYRLYGTKFFMDEVCLIHDIDLFFINDFYLKEKIEHINQKDLVILFSDGYDSSRPECTGVYAGDGFRYPLHGIIGLGSLISKIVKNEINFEEFANNILGLNYHYFDTDEIYFASCLKQQNDVVVHKLKRGYSSNFYCPNRIEKRHFKNDSNMFDLNLNGSFNLDSFIDCHCATPFYEYKEIINKIKNQIISK